MKKLKRYKSQLTEDSLTDTSEFKRWFGHSKIIENGEPLIVYHGTNHRFNVFDQKNIGLGKGNFGHYGYGFYFSYDIREAKIYGSIVMPVYLSIQKPLDASNINALSKYAKEFGDYEKVDVAIDKNWLLSALKQKDRVAYELAILIIKYGYEKGWEYFLQDDKVSDARLDLNEVSEWVSLTNTEEKVELNNYVIEDITKQLGKPKIIKDYPFHSVPQMKYMTNLGGAQAKELTELIKKDGYDGVIAGSEIVAFYPNQIKSAVDNSGNFSRSNDSIVEKHSSIKKYKLQINS